MADLPDWLLALLGQQGAPQGAPALAGNAPGGLLSGSMPPALGGLLTAPRPVPVDAGMDNASDPNTPIRTASRDMTQGRSVATGGTDQADTPTSGTNVVGTPASGTTEASSPGFLSKAGTVLGSLYGQGGPGDSLIQLGAGIASPEGWAKGVAQASQNMGNNQLNQARLQAFKLQMAQQQAGQSATYNYLRRQGVSHDDASNAIQAAAGGNDQLLKSFISQNDQSEKYNYQNVPGVGLVAVPKYQPIASPDKKTGEITGGPTTIVPVGGSRPITDAERQQFGIPADAGPYVMNPQTGKPEPVAASADPEAKAKSELLGQIQQNFPKSQENAIAAVRTKEAIQRQKDALDKGILTGSGADLITNFRAAAAQALGITDPKVINSQEFDAFAKAKGAELAKAISNSGHTTNADVLLGQAISGGDRNKMEAAIRSILDANNTLADETIGRHNSSIDKFSKLAPKSADAANFYRVEVPDFSKQQPTNVARSDPLASAREAIARGASRQAVMNRLLQNNINPAGL